MKLWEIACIGLAVFIAIGFLVVVVRDTEEIPQWLDKLSEKLKKRGK